MKNFRVTSLGLLLLSMLVLTACQGAKNTPTVVAPTVATAPVQSYSPQTPYDNPGSLYAESDIDPLFSDSRARRVGDIVVVNIMESSQATNTATTDADKESSNDYGVSSLFGRTSFNMIPLVGATKAPVGPGTSVFQSNSFSEHAATGQTSRGNSVTSSIASRVIKVLPGGILQLEGVRQTRINEETQYMVISGTIRARDIAADNTIMSTQMADANIQYYGKGILADKQKPGWFTRFMDNLWPF